MALSKPRHRQQPSDPFSDQATISYSSYGVPTLARNAPKQSATRPPPIPPKVPPKSARMGDNVADAVREVVTVRRVDPSSPPRTRMGRSQTQLPPPSTSKPVAPPTRRSASQDSTPVPPEKDKGKRRIANKKGSTHADVIDRLDFSGVGPMFHHDGPFDACAPSRNRHRTKAPMYAWSGAPDEDKDAFAAAREIPASPYASPYPTPGVWAPYEAPKKKHDAIAEAWGVHEPEPYEDFSAGGGYNPRVSGEYNSSRGVPATGASRKPREGKEKYREPVEEAPAAARRIKRTNLPPPQPVFGPDGEIEGNSPPSPGLASSPGAPRRSKSLMQRIRKMRDSPNVPVNYEEMNGSDQDAMASSAENGVAKATRPTHRSQNSFLGRLGRGANVPSKEGTSPTSDSEQFVYVDATARARKDKSLPATPPVKGGTPPGENVDGYFDSSEFGGYAGSPGGGLGRKASLLKKMKGVVKGTNAK
ncbi:hypothetical protein BXZ70DRAFT_905901 [Cristinia sonorae]|uniref:Pal1 cell morphology n=1 Tax=Cristinia sonorae TaxID=1940300 RepID=A0A8K0UU32_9AGAR|nr:hypothetical protein BXZ70DRAFT_905901 [Cristinia sonorae]